jgi:adenylate cyclase class 2
MQPEIEVKFLNLKHDEVRATLRDLGAELEHPMRLMRRVLFDYSDKRLQKTERGRLRVRDEGDKVTVTYKSKVDNGYSDELETTVGSFEKMTELFTTIGLEAYSFQESKRETWKYHDVEIVLDEWPWLETYIEIEGQSEAAIQNCTKLLGLDWNVAVYGSVDSAYRRQYPKLADSESIGDLPEVRFGEPLPEWLSQRA